MANNRSVGGFRGPDPVGCFFVRANGMGWAVFAPDSNVLVEQFGNGEWFQAQKRANARNAAAKKGA